MYTWNTVLADLKRNAGGCVIALSSSFPNLCSKKIYARKTVQAHVNIIMVVMQVQCRHA